MEDKDHFINEVPLPSKNIFSIGKKDVQDESSKVESNKTEENSKEESTFKKAQGAIIGALWGDAIGVTLKLIGAKITKKKIETALKMPGGGWHGLGPGQITDNGEMIMWLLNAFSENEGGMDLYQIARFYANWVHSKPFNYENTCRKSLLWADIKNPDPNAIKKAALSQKKSLSNGSIVRVPALALLCHKMPAEDIQKATHEESLFTHPNKTVHLIAHIYCYALTSLITSVPLPTIRTYIDAFITDSQNPTLNTCLQASTEDALVDTKKEGAEVCLILLLKVLDKLQEEDSTEGMFERHIGETLVLGGDTTGNWWVVGAILGAYLGVEGISEDIRDKVLNWEFKKDGGVRRKEFLVPKLSLMKLIKKVFQESRDSLEIVDQE
jgi:ADP-ribosyl-[dinitrogen reductase] hydrolase